MQIEFMLISIAVLIISAILHEVAHGYAAEGLGDPTARMAGRLTLNPVSHVDPMGSLLIPGILILSGAGFVFGWAKPVPYNPYNIRGGRWGEAWVAFAGPLTNIAIALIFAALLRFRTELGLEMTSFIEIGSLIVFINILLALFNLIPIPPLDGSKVLSAILPRVLHTPYERLSGLIDRLGFVGIFLVIFLFVFVLSDPFFAFVSWVFQILTGISFF